MDSKRVIVVDYGLGNLHSVNKAVAKAGGKPEISASPEVIREAEKIILPGVGAFADCMANLKRSGLIPVLREHFLADKPFLGICLGMQALFESSEEGPGVPGLGFFQGKVIYIPTKCKVPHVGWNHLHIKKSSPVEGEAEGKYVYFTHSYCCVPQDTSLISSVCEHGTEIVAGICRGNIFGVQYHPEKSSCVGMEMLHRFVTL